MSIKSIGSNMIRGDIAIWMIFFFLCMGSIMEMYSASSSLITTGHHMDPLLSHTMTLVFGGIVMLIVQFIPCKYYKVLWKPFLIISLIMLLFAFFGHARNDTMRWMNLFGLSVQPSEFAKTAMVMALAAKLSGSQIECKKRRGKEIISYPKAIKGGELNPFKWCLAIILPVLVFILPENFSTAVIVWVIGTIMMFIGNIPKKYMIRWWGTFIALGTLGLIVLVVTPDTTLRRLQKRAPVWKHRITDKFKAEKTVDKNKTYTLDEVQEQENAAAVTVANSNIHGRGVGNSEGRNFLQHAESDFIYAIIIEETGICGAIIVIGLYLWLLMRASKIASKCDLFFPAYLALGLGIMMVFQAFINMGVAVGLLPTTGQTLPLLSRGGSSIMAVCINLGIILSVSRYAEAVSRQKKLILEEQQNSLISESDEYSSSEGMN